jgi:hypothetical protein
MILLIILLPLKIATQGSLNLKRTLLPLKTDTLDSLNLKRTLPIIFLTLKMVLQAMQPLSHVLKLQTHFKDSKQFVE